jgi:cytochrome c-type biogenesis protein CcmH/NrfF
MPSNAAGPDDRLNVRQMVIWSVFMALLVLGVVLWFRFSNRIVPMLDAFTDR